MNAKTAIDAARDQFKSQVKDLRQASTTPAQTKEQLQNAIGAKREALKTLIDAQKADLKTKLQTIKDARKRQVVEKINEEIQNLNTRRTDHYSDVLNKLSAAVGRIGTRADNAAGRGLDVSSVRTDLDAAKAAIKAAQDAILVQAGKVYTITVTNDATLKSNVGATRQALYNDLKALNEKVRAAYDAVHKAATDLAQIPKVDDDHNHEATSTPSASTTTPTNTQ